MSFSAATCLTYTAETQLGPTLYFFSDADNYTDSFGSAPTSDLVAPNCPFVITGIPDGSLFVRLRDYESGCCIDILIESSSLCTICNFFFDVLEPTGVALITAGNLEGTCSPEPTDYVVNWYGPNSSENVGYSSGIGNLFDYQYQHPLTGTSAIFAEAGTYVPVIHKIVVDGVYYSNILTPGFYPAALNCFSPVTVGALRCNNGNQPEELYTHFYEFTATGQGVTPSPLSATFELSSTTKFFPFKFRAEGVSDTIKITLNSVNYDVPIVLEDVELGNNIGGTDLNSFPRRIDTLGYAQKILTLTGFTINEGDSLTIQITPNETNPATRWYFGCDCATDFDCSTCLDEYISSPYPILSGTVTSTVGACDLVNIAFEVSGNCTSDEIDNMDITKYMGSLGPGSNSGVKTDNITKKISLGVNGLYHENVECNVSSVNGFQCEAPSNNTITYTKTVVGGEGRLTITCSNNTDFLDFYNTYLSVYNTWEGTPDDPSNVQYYRYFAVGVPNPANTPCGDGTIFNEYNIHFSSTVTTSGSGPWTIQFTMPTIVNQLTWTSCDLGCESRTNQVVNNINNASTGTSNNINVTSNNGNKASAPVRAAGILTEQVEQDISRNYNGRYRVTSWQGITIGWTGESNTYVPQFSGEPCTFDTWNKTDLPIYRKDVYAYIVSLTNPASPGDFDISGTTIVNSAYNGYPGPAVYQLALRYQGGVITYADPYFVK